jgi:hypothetical protein
MTVRTLLVFLDDDPRCETRATLAARFAARHGSHLVGIAPTGRIDLPASVQARCTTSTKPSPRATRRCAARSTRSDHFRTRCRAEGAGSVEAHAHEGDKAAVVLHHAHCADLVVIGQSDPAADRAQHRFVEQVLVANARPTLLVPHAGPLRPLRRQRAGGLGRQPLLRPAVADALPVLRTARQVHLRLWRRGGEADDTALQERMAGVQRWLERQDVPAEMHDRHHRRCRSATRSCKARRRSAPTSS